MIQILRHIKAQSFETLKLKNFLKKPSNLLSSLESVTYQNCIYLAAKSQYEQVEHVTTAKFSANFIVTMNLIFSKP